VLFAGLMLTDAGPRLIEYNARFGDPECQVLMTRLESDLAALLFAAAAGQVDDAPPARFSKDFALTVVMAANGYPGRPIMGGEIGGLDAAQADGATVFHAGTTMTDGRLVASGGRVLNITARGISVTQAQQRAYAAVDRIDFPDGFCRRDIGWREVARENGGAR
jgi:phosphoribosylamine--glycine ligase